MVESPPYSCGERQIARGAPNSSRNTILIVDHHLLAEDFGELLRDEAPVVVVRAAGHECDDQAQRFGGKVCAGSQWKCNQRRGDKPAEAKWTGIGIDLSRRAKGINPRV